VDHTSDPRHDRELVDAFLASGDERAFRALYGRHSPVMWRLSLRLVGGVDRDAEEVLQTAWLRAARALDRFRWESELRTWLSGIAINCAREVLRKRRRDGLEFAETLPDRPAPPLHREIPALDLERAIARLPDGYREVLVLHDVEGYTHQEIGGLLGIEAGTSKSQLSRARRAVRRLLSEDPALDHAPCPAALAKPKSLRTR
jgi:RNA polymerase sigma-70 factor (ECF subfamily)